MHPGQQPVYLCRGLRESKFEDFMRCTENALHFYGGVPRALVPDNLKSAVAKSSHYEPKVNEAFADFAEHYETAVLPTRTYRSRDKAIVERMPYASSIPGSLHRCATRPSIA